VRHDFYGGREDPSWSGRQLWCEDAVAATSSRLLRCPSTGPHQEVTKQGSTKSGEADGVTHTAVTQDNPGTNEEADRWGRQSTLSAACPARSRATRLGAIGPRGRDSD
jgi:hypothetical protein